MRIIIHADLNSFFATAEQQTNLKLRGKPVGVVKAKGRSCIIASSIEAKKLGIKTGARSYEALKICPQIILVPANFEKYEELSLKFIKICKSYSPLVEVFSLDECFIDLTEVATFWTFRPMHLTLQEKAWVELVKNMGYGELVGALKIIFDLKRRLREEAGDYMSVSVGISHNKLLAKLGSEQIKYDGLFWIRPDNVIDILDNSKLTDVCGLGYGLSKHLTLLGINDFAVLRTKSIDFLRQHFGPHWSLHLYNICRGLDPTAVASVDELADAKSVGRTYTAHKPLNSRSEILQLSRNLAEEAAAKARYMGLSGRYVGYSLRTSVRNWSGESNEGENDESWYGHMTLKNYISTGVEIYEICKRISERWRLRDVIFCGITLGMLKKSKFNPIPLFEKDRKIERLTANVDTINERYGDYTVFPAQLLGMPIIMPEVTGYFGDRKYRLDYLQKGKI